ncbi:MAG: hypothetical protein GY765_29470, partial [bacterium]|nr:hypothetical protein [bacterium]
MNLSRYLMRRKVFSDQFPVEILRKVVFAKEPLEQDEHIVACWDDSHAFLNLKKYRWKRGGIISNLSLYLWNKETVQRFHLIKIEDLLNIDTVDAFDSRKVWRFRFRYEKKMIHFSIPANKTLFDAFINRISDGQTTLMRTPAGISYGRCSLCQTFFEGIIFPFSLGMNFKENGFSISDLEKFDCKNLIFFC